MTKKYFFNFIFCLVLSACALTVKAQQIVKIPTDPAVRIGKLSNGLTYYICHNALPEKRAFFYIAQKVGAIQEEPQQRGLAHFLEHMCFNGSKHFPGNSLIHCMERYGVKFGDNLNAYTAVDETVYNIDNVPTADATAIDSCLWALHDWSNDLTLDPKEIDNERGVIHEEWRGGDNASKRVMEKMLPVILAGSKYADAMPIGSMDVVMNFKPQVLRDYYEKWYRPDLQGIVVVGDINVDQIEAKIKQIFSDIPAQPAAAKRIYYTVPDNAEPIVFTGTDKELTKVSVGYYFKHRGVEDKNKVTMDYCRKNLINNMISSMIGDRYEEMMHQSVPPFIGASAGDGAFSIAKTEDAFCAAVTCKENDIKGGIMSMLREVMRAKKYGFTQSELDRNRTDYLRELESMYNERDKQQSSSLVSMYVRNFLDNEPIPSVEDCYKLYSEMAKSLTLAEINAAMKKYITDNNLVVTMQAPEKADLKLPSKQDLLNYLAQAKAEQLQPYKDKTVDASLISKLPKAGKVVSARKNATMGTTEYMLSNGVKVVVKKTDFLKDDISMIAVSKGGTSLYPDNEIINLKNIGVASLGGLAKYSNIDLGKMLTGKVASASASISLTMESVNGACSPKDLETMMQLAYLTFTAPRKDQVAFDAYKMQLKASLKNKEALPQTALQDTITKALYGDNPRVVRMKENMVDKIDYDKILDIYKERFANAADFTFFFVGNVDEAKLKPMLCKYVASLPASSARENFKKMLFPRKGIYTNEFVKEEKTPKTTIILNYSGAEKLSLRNSMMADILGQIMDMVYTKTIREDAGAAYTVSSSCSLNDYPEEQVSLEIAFPTDPAKKELALKLVKEGLEKVINEGPSQEYLDKVKEYMLKVHAESIKKNSYWMSVLTQQWLNSIDFSKDYEQTLKSITAKDIQQFTARLYKQNNQILVTMTSPAAK